MSISRRLTQLKKGLVLLRHPLFRHGLRHGVGASIEHCAALAPLKLKTVIDIGANVGQFTLLIRALFPQAHIVAFEPLARPANKYRKLFAADKVVTFYQAAIAPTSEQRRMHVSRRDDSSSLLPISSRQVEFAPGTETVRMEKVDLAPLSHFISVNEIVRPALLKLDVQGFELEALKASETLLSQFDYIYVEVSFVPLYEGQVLAHELIDWLAERSFLIEGAGNPAYGNDKRIVQLDLLFRNSAANAA